MSNGMIPSEGRPQYLSDPAVQYDNSDLRQYAKPPRIKVVQAMSQPPIKPNFKDGDVLIIPQMVKIGDLSESFTFVPVAFFMNWICLNPIEAKGTLPSIRGFTFDPEDPIAKKAKSFIKEKCPEQPDYFLKYRSTLNFIVIVEHPEFVDMPVHLFFSSGEYNTGQQFIGMLESRHAPRYACRFRAVSGMHTGKRGNWYGLNIMNPPNPWIEEEATFKKYEKLYTELKQLIDSRTLELDMTEVSAAEDTVANSEF